MQRTPALTENIDDYMRDIRGYALITPEEEIRLAGVMRTGTGEERREARDRLICANLRLVVKIAHDFKKYGLGFADLVAEGNIGLVVAADKFDPAKGAKFSCYAAWWIKQYMRNAVISQPKTIRVPAGSAQRMIAIGKARSRYTEEHGKEPTAEQLAVMTGCATVTVERLLHVSVETLSMNETVSEESSATFENVLSETSDRKQAEGAFREGVRKALDRLSELDRYLVATSYGIYGPVKEPPEQAQYTGLPVPRVKARVAEALAKLRELVKDSLDDEEILLESC